MPSFQYVLFRCWLFPLPVGALIIVRVVTAFTRCRAGLYSAFPISCGVGGSLKLLPCSTFFLSSLYVRSFKYRKACVTGLHVSLCLMYALITTGAALTGETSGRAGRRLLWSHRTKCRFAGCLCRGGSVGSVWLALSFSCTPCAGARACLVVGENKHIILFQPPPEEGERLRPNGLFRAAATALYLLF